jgi:hypothetical protein
MAFVFTNVHIKQVIDQANALLEKEEAVELDLDAIIKIAAPLFAKIANASIKAPALAVVPASKGATAPAPPSDKKAAGPFSNFFSIMSAIGSGKTDKWSKEETDAIVGAVGALTLSSTIETYKGAKGEDNATLTKVSAYLDEHSGAGELFDVEFPSLVEAIAAIKEAKVCSGMSMASLLWKNLNKEQQAFTARGVALATLAGGPMPEPKVKATGKGTTMASKTSEGKLKRSGHNLIKKVWIYADKCGFKEKVKAYKDATGKSSGMELGVMLWKHISQEMREAWHDKSTSQEEQGPAFNEAVCKELLGDALDFAEEHGYEEQPKK